jgi:hypothetical protein
LNFNKLSKPQLECLGHYAFPGLYPPKIFSTITTHSLVKRGLLTKIERRDGNFVIYDYEMPESVRIDYCGWCHETVEEEL